MKKLIISISIVIVVALIAFFGICLLSSQTELTADRNHGQLCDLPIINEPVYVMAAPGLQFKMDTGADFSAITKRDLAYLDSLGYKIEELTYPVFGRNGRGDLAFHTKRYRVSIPTYRYTTSNDSLGNTLYTPIEGTLNVLHNVDFVPALTEFSVLGVDFLEKFKMEFKCDKRMIALHFEEPEGYIPCAKLNISYAPDKLLWLGNRYYIKAAVERHPNNFFIDTGLYKAMIKMPENKKSITRNQLYNDTVTSLRGKYPAYTDTDAWISIGDREGVYYAFYYDNDEEDYALNPINIYNQDVLIDFPGKELKLRPYTTTIPRKLRY